MAFRSRLKKGAIVEIELLGGHELSYQGKVVKVGFKTIVLCTQSRLTEKEMEYIAGKHHFPPKTISDISVDTNEYIHIRKKFILLWKYLSLDNIHTKTPIESEETLDLIYNSLNFYGSDGFCKG